jgi:hypothetical protein
MVAVWLSLTGCGPADYCDTQVTETREKSVSLCGDIGCEHIQIKGTGPSAVKVKMRECSHDALGDAMSVTMYFNGELYHTQKWGEGANANGMSDSYTFDLSVIHTDVWILEVSR